jgi:hypothetical protein
MQNTFEENCAILPEELRDKILDDLVGIENIIYLIVPPVLLYSWATVKEIIEDRDRRELFRNDTLHERRVCREIHYWSFLTKHMNEKIKRILTRITDEFMENAERLTTSGDELDSFFEFFDYNFDWETASPLNRFKVMLEWNEWIIECGYDIHNMWGDLMVPIGYIEAEQL